MTPGTNAGYGAPAAGYGTAYTATTTSSTPWLTILIIVAVVLVLLTPLIIAMVRAARTPRKKISYVPQPDPEREELYAQKLSRMVRCETISARGANQRKKFLTYHSVLAGLFPRVHKHLEKTEIDGNLLFKWSGESSEQPVMLMAHQDVVEAGDGWTQDPFGGKITGGKVWGRGSADTKCSHMAFMQAVEELLAEGYTPRRDIYLASSCTEEIGGPGASKIAQHLKEQGVKLFMLCDEGGALVRDPIKGVKGVYGMVGLFEKGYGDVLFTAESRGGHASAPSKNTPLVRLGKFMARVDKRSPFKASFEPAVKNMFKTLAPYAGFGKRLVFGNLWLFGPIIKATIVKSSPQAAAMLRTTICFTTAQGAQGYNVIPQAATVGANMRFIPHQDMGKSLKRITRLARRYDLMTEIITGNPASRVLDTDSDAYRLTRSVMNEVFPGVPCTPYIVTGGTDCRFFDDVAENCVRFSPVIYGQEQQSGMHGADECIETACLPGAVDYYKTLIKKL